MHVCILTNKFPPCLDGVGDYSYHLANEFQRHGHQISVLCRQDKTIQQAVANGQFNILVSPTVPVWNWLAIRPLRRFIHQQRPDWLLVQYVPNGFQRWAIPIWLPILLWIARYEGVRVSITFHEVYTRMTYWPVNRWIIAVLQRIVCKLLTCLADVVITSIDLYAIFLRRYTHKLIHLIPIGSTILPVPITPEERIAIRKEIAPNGEFIISTFGLRNQDFLLHIFEKILEKQSNTCLLICSRLNISASYQKCFERLNDRITVTGFMDSAQVYRYLRCSDVFFMPDEVNNRGEGGTSNKSTSLASGLMAGLPIIAIKGDMNNGLLHQIPGLFLGNPAEPELIVQHLLTTLTNHQPLTLTEDINCFFDEELSWAAIYHRYVICMTQPHAYHNDTVTG